MTFYAVLDFEFVTEYIANALLLSHYQWNQRGLTCTATCKMVISFFVSRDYVGLGLLQFNINQTQFKGSVIANQHIS